MAVTPLRDNPPLLDTNALPSIVATGAILANGSVPLTNNWNAGAWNITAANFTGNLTGNVTGPGAGITGVVFQDGTRPLTATWPAGNYPINAKNSVDWINVVTAGADPTGAADSTAAIQGVLTALTSGQTAYIPAGIYKITNTLQIGNGTSTGAATADGLNIIGCGVSKRIGGTVPSYPGGTQLAWYGAAGIPMIQVNGPIAGLRMGGFYLDAKVGANAASSCLVLKHPYLSHFFDIECFNQTGFAVILTAYPSVNLAPALVFAGANGNTFDRISTSWGTGNSFGGLQVGETTIDMTGGSAHLDPAQNTFVGCGFYGGSTGIACELRYCDNSSMYQTSIVGNNYGLVMTPPTETGNAPAAWAFYNCYVEGTTAALNVDSSHHAWAPAGGVGAIFLPWPTDASTSPWNPPHAGFKAIVDDGTVNMTSATLSENVSALPSPVLAGTILQTASADGVATIHEIDSFGNAPIQVFRRSQGTNATPTAVQNNQGIALITAYGRGATGWSAAGRASIRALTQENWTDTKQGVRWDIDATAAGGVVTGTKMTVAGEGVGINTTTPTRDLDLNGVQKFEAVAPPALSDPNSATVYYDGASDTLKCSLNGGAYVDVIGSGGLTGSGTATKLAYWTGATNLNGAADIRIDPVNSYVGIKVTPLYEFDVNGDINIALTKGLRLGGAMLLTGRAFTGGVGGFIALGNGISATPGQYTVIVGDQAAPSSTGDHNTIVGSDTSFNLTTGSENVFLGYNGGVTCTTGNRNICIGSRSGVGAGAQTNSISIGYNVVAATDNVIALGNAGMKCGIATNAPQTTLDVPGSFALRKQGLALVNGLNSNITTPEATFLRITGPSAGFSVGGFTGGVDGRYMTLFNAVVQQMTIVNNDGSSLAANRIYTLTGGNVVLRAGVSAVNFVYDSSLNLWILIGTN